MLLSSAFAWVALAAFTSTSEAFTIPSSAHGASLAARSANPKLAAAMHYTLKPVKGSKLKKRNSACSSKAIDRESQSKATASPTPSPSKTCKSSSSPSKATSTSLSSATASSVPEFYVGANSYFVHALQEEDRLEVLDAMVAANMKVLRIFLSYTYHNNKGSGSVEMPDLEPSKVGEYDDTILKAIDQLMVECKERGLKLLIALHDRYSLGFWSTDAYAREFGIVDPDSRGAQKVADATVFYEQDPPKIAFDKRIDYILSHKNSLMDNRPWSELDDVIYALEPENEPMGHMEFVPTWTCDRAGRIKENLPKNSPILVSTGGGTTISNSLDDWAYSCDAFDIISVHDYGTTVSSTVPQLSSGMEKAKEYGKTIMFGEWGASGVSKAAIISDFVSALADAKIPHMIWQLVKPGAGSEDFELWTDEDAWQPFLDNSSYSKRMVKRTLPAMRKASYSPRAHAAPLHQQWTAKRQAASAIRAESLASRPHGLH